MVHVAPGVPRHAVVGIPGIILVEVHAASDLHREARRRGSLASIDVEELLAGADRAHRDQPPLVMRDEHPDDIRVATEDRPESEVLKVAGFEVRGALGTVHADNIGAGSCLDGTEGVLG